MQDFFSRQVYKFYKAPAILAVCRTDTHKLEFQIEMHFFFSSETADTGLLKN